MKLYTTAYKQMNWKPGVHCQIQVYSVSLAKSRKENEQ